MISVNIFSSHGKYTLEGKITLRRIFTRTVLYYGEDRIYGRWTEKKEREEGLGGNRGIGNR